MDDDTLYAGSGNDTLDGGTGNGDDILYGGTGDDTFEVMFGGNTAYGGDDADTFGIGFGRDTVFGGEGGDDHDTLSIADADDAVTITFTGADTGTFSDTDGDSGAFQGIETFELSTAADTVAGSASTSDIIVLAGGGDDSISAGSGNDSLTGAAGNDTLYGGVGDDFVDGGADADRLYGGVGRDTIDGGAGDDQILFGEGDDVVYGGSGDDTIDDEGGDPAYSGANLVYGGIGNDTIFTGRGDDTIYGGDGQDRLYAQLGNDTVFAGDGADFLGGLDGDDTLFAGDGADTLFGDAGNDRLSGGLGNDTITGGTSDDIFILSNAGGDDSITDFSTGDALDASALTDVGNALTNQDGTVTADEVTVTGGGGSDQVLTFPSGETVTVPDGTVDTSTQANQFASLVSMGVLPCFAPGTHVLTARGEVRVEDLTIGDLVITADRGAQPLRWMGRRSETFASREDAQRPVLFKQGSLGDGLPKRNLIVSPLHRIVLAGSRVRAAFGDPEVLALSKALTGLRGVRRMNGRSRIDYFSLLLDRHEIIFAEGIPTESFRPGPVAMGGFEAQVREQIYSIYPRLRAEPIRGLGPMARPLVGRTSAERFANTKPSTLVQHALDSQIVGAGSVW